MLQAIGLTSAPRRDLPPAVDDLTFEAPPGKVTALLGDTGSGKTTALRLMLELEPGRGVTYFRGRPLHRVPQPAREVGVLLGDLPGNPSRTVRNQLRMLCAAAGVPAARADAMLEVVGLAGLRDQRLGSLSLGMERRLGLAAALLADPCTLLLDEPAAGLSPRERNWVYGLMRSHAALGGAVLYTTDDAKEAARSADQVVSIAGGRLVADQDAAAFARTRLRPRVAVRTPHAARLADVLGREARDRQRAVEIVAESGTRLSVYGSSCAEIGETAYRHGVLVHQLADETGDTGTPVPHPSPSTPAPPDPDRAAWAAPLPDAQAWADSTASTRPQAGAGAAARPGPEAGDEAVTVRPAAGAGAEVGGGVAPVRPAAGVRAEVGDGVVTVRHAAEVGGGAATVRPAAGAELGNGAALVRPAAGAGAEVGRRLGAGTGSRPWAPAGPLLDAGATAAAAPRLPTFGAVPAPASVSLSAPASASGSVSAPVPISASVPGSASASVPGSAPVSAVPTLRPAPGAVATPATATPATVAAAVGGGAGGGGMGVGVGGVAGRAWAGSGVPVCGVRRVGGPLRPWRYEVRRMFGTATPVLTAVVVVVVSVLVSLVLARAGRAPQSRLLAAWPQLLPLPPAALGAGLLGALAFGEEYRYPALAAHRGTVPRRLGLLGAKLGVCGALALVLGALAVGADAGALWLVFGRGPLRSPAVEWIAPAVSWAGLLVGCAWAGVLASGVFRSALAGLGAVLAVPLLVVPPVRRALDGPSAHPASGLAARLRGLPWNQWPPEADRLVRGAVRVLAQPVGAALTLSVMVLLCAYGFTGLRSRVRW
ncbi:ATP-binding cassette domain-containing protein [Streptomyces antimicrobicus]|uniref:ATP-binding cassette domain-containing protein n=1 Tax=Streptomyces antimicrobicus TaxID=2883108 RepID=A0ABS8B6K6_9ACTN|nr:ATP-binding cassette domain-containing protein [Streptomyces antimicrobicus]MCB5180244.1 ATP-binding cassette domain-containing protein [Streptomyces antimicrobicus]